ncbi:MAG TPA: DUF3800 domain-containing protein [Candidatus Acidoferrum sp.]
MDDSGTHKQSPICVLAGYFGGVRQWARFEREWRHILGKAGVEEFHSKRFWARTPEGKRVDEYEDWSDKQADLFLAQLLEAIGSYRIFPIGCALVMQDWLALSEPERRYLTGARLRRGKLRTSGAPNKPYFLPFIRNIGKMASYCAEHLKIHFAFDRNETYSGYALDYYKTLEEMQLRYWKRLGDLSFPTSHEAPPLQAADLLAYHLNLHAQQRLNGSLHAKCDADYVLARALKNAKDVSQDLKLFNKKGLDLILSNFRKAFDGKVNHDANAKGKSTQ